MASPNKRKLSEEHFLRDLDRLGDLADLESRLIAGMADRDIPAGEKFKFERCLEPLREEVRLRLHLPLLRRRINSTKTEYQFACSAAGNQKHRRQMTDMYGRDHGVEVASKRTDKEKARVALAFAKQELISVQKRLHQLRRYNAKWGALVTKLPDKRDDPTQMNEGARHLEGSGAPRRGMDVRETAWEKYRQPQKYQFMSFAEAAAILERSVKRVYGLVAEKKIVGHKGRIIIASLREYLTPKD